MSPITLHGDSNDNTSGHGIHTCHCIHNSSSVGAAANILEGPEKAFSRDQLVASMGQALAEACRGKDPDPRWLGPINATMFLSVVDDMIWIFLGANFDDGFPLINRCAPATYYELAGIGLPFPSGPFNLLTFHQ